MKQSTIQNVWAPGAEEREIKLALALCHNAQVVIRTAHDRPWMLPLEELTAVNDEMIIHHLARNRLV
jgi:hypothetical protein